jgi:hypothetical protein
MPPFSTAKAASYPSTHTTNAGAVFILVVVRVIGWTTVTVVIERINGSAGASAMRVTVTKLAGVGKMNEKL